MVCLNPHTPIEIFHISTENKLAVKMCDQEQKINVHVKRHVKSKNGWPRQHSDIVNGNKF